MSATTGTGTSTPAQLPVMPVEVQRAPGLPGYATQYGGMQPGMYGSAGAGGAHYAPPAHTHSHSHSHSYTHHPVPAYPPLHPSYHHAQPPPPAIPSKRLAPPHPHPSESPAKKKQSKWTPDEDASIIELRGNGMKWEDISKHLPGRSAISCRLRFQNYLERRAEWDEERKNKLARLYERYVPTIPPTLSLQVRRRSTMLTASIRFKKDMWEKIAKEMQLPWRAAENMHWQIGEVEMAQRANVPVFHTAGQSTTSTAVASSSSSAVPVPLERTPSLSPPHKAAAARPLTVQHTHKHSLPQIHPLGPSHSQTQPPSPVSTREAGRRNSTSPPTINTASPSTGPPHPGLRRRADSARAVPTLGGGGGGGGGARWPLLPPVGELTRERDRGFEEQRGLAVRYPLPPVSVGSGGDEGRR